MGSEHAESETLWINERQFHPHFYERFQRTRACSEHLEWQFTNAPLLSPLQALKRVITVLCGVEWLVVFTLTGSFYWVVALFLSAVKARTGLHMLCHHPWCQYPGEFVPFYLAHTCNTRHQTFTSVCFYKWRFLWMLSAQFMVYSKSIRPQSATCSKELKALVQAINLEQNSFCPQKQKAVLSHKTRRTCLFKMAWKSYFFQRDRFLKSVN